MINILLCGGSGTRLWPLSRTLMPKQFIKLFDEQSLFQKTLNRNTKLVNKTLVVSNAEQFFIAKDQVDELNLDRIDYFVETIAKNTAPAIALSCLSLNPEQVVLVTPSDHLVTNENAYEKAVQEAKLLAEQGYLVTFGIKPDFPETGFGYIEANDSEVVSFKEKPDFATAQSYVNSGRFFWNSGMFCFKAGVFLEALAEHHADMYRACVEAYNHHLVEDGVIRIPFDSMNAIPENSIDYAVMEKANNIRVVVADVGWSDVGSFDSLAEELPKDDNGNTLLKRGEADVPVVTLNAHCSGQAFLTTLLEQFCQ